MSDKNFRNIPEWDRIDKETGTQKPEADAAGQASQIYRFEFGDDGTIYSTVFEGNITQEDARKILEALHSQLYENCAGAIRSYLEQHHLEYSHFRTETSTAGHDAVMRRTKEFLLSRSCDTVDSYAKGADNYYAVMDYQKWFYESRCEGCYYAIQKTTGHKAVRYHIVGQIFTCDKYGGNENEYFAIRSNEGNDENEGSRKLHNIDESATTPALPLFGCVDIVEILRNIDNIKTHDFCCFSHEWEK